MEKIRIAVILPAGKLFDRTFEAIGATEQDLGPCEFSRISTDLSGAKLKSAFTKLESANSIIADLTARNPNVMFLTGYARALKKPITFITQHAEDFPFDQSTAPIVYGSDPNFLRTELVAQLSGQRSTPSGKGDDARAKFLSIFGDLLQKHGHEHHGPILEDQPNVYILINQDMDLPLVQDIARRARELKLRVKLM
jgi:hypothetical protein